ncbi:hypothetical protein [Chromobacterium sp. IIBBL 290-4]|nr:hypothetical protein [Chromobacterium sp. IIBBL 290-4]
MKTAKLLISIEINLLNFNFPPALSLEKQPSGTGKAWRNFQKR